MTDFKIEDDIPIPKEPEELVIDEPEDILPEDEPSIWVPYKPGKRKCPNNQHHPMIGKCLKCGDIFPCPSGNCGHFDCHDPSLAGLDCDGNGTSLPESFGSIRPDPMSRLTDRQVQLQIEPEEDFEAS